MYKSEPLHSHPFLPVLVEIVTDTREHVGVRDFVMKLTKGSKEIRRMSANEYMQAPNFHNSRGPTGGDLDFLKQQHTQWIRVNESPSQPPGVSPLIPDHLSPSTPPTADKEAHTKSLVNLFSKSSSSFCPTQL